MTASKPNVLELAKQGNPKAIAALINRQFRSEDVRAVVSLKDKTLSIILIKSLDPPTQEKYSQIIERGIISLNPRNINNITIYGKSENEAAPNWSFSFPNTNVQSETHHLSHSEEAKSGKLAPASSKFNQSKQSIKSSFSNNSTDQNNQDSEAEKHIQYGLWILSILFLLSSSVYFLKFELITSIKLLGLGLLSLPLLADKVVIFLLRINRYINLPESYFRSSKYQTICVTTIFAASILSINFSSSSPLTSVDIPTQPRQENTEQSELIEEFGKDRYDSMEECQNRMIEQNASAEEIVQECNPSSPDEITPLSQEEVLSLMCEVALQDSSNPYYADCIREGY